MSASRRFKRPDAPPPIRSQVPRKKSAHPIRAPDGRPRPTSKSQVPGFAAAFSMDARIRQAARPEPAPMPIKKPQPRRHAVCFLKMERVKRIELSRLAWEARALPLSYTRWNTKIIAKNWTGIKQNLNFFAGWVLSRFTISVPHPGKT